MLAYSLKRILLAIPTMFVVIAISFFMIRLAPGGPFDLERTLPKEIEEKPAAGLQSGSTAHRSVRGLSAKDPPGRSRTVLQVPGLHRQRTHHERFPGLAPHWAQRHPTGAVPRYRPGGPWPPCDRTRVSTTPSWPPP